ncbi:uncharacterized protein LOC127129583 [Lathyrus oleraceus]|uniref:uncharacterized protein LOC127129583 n=1 Tax=Pisum sativum TaxID=3888 RepID=UPI0021D3B0EB|nr:uncharacterized protein LOC127129583 [Pisum sativum]
MGNDDTIAGRATDRAATQDVHDPAVEIDATHVVIEVANEVVQPDVVVDEVTATNLDPSVTRDTEVTVPSMESSLHTNGTFSGRPIDWSIFTEYVDHVAYRLWQGEVTSHVSKMKNFPKTPMPKQVRRIVHDFGFLTSVDCSLTMLDVSLLTDFIEQWHKETYSFHLPFREITITLDDVSSLFHLTIADRFLTAPIISMSLARMVVVRDLGVSEEIYEYFSTICDGRVQHSLVEAPRVRRWKAMEAHLDGVAECRWRLDAFTVDGVIKTPYTDHKVYHEFDDPSFIFWLYTVGDFSH